MRFNIIYTPGGTTRPLFRHKAGDGLLTTERNTDATYTDQEGILRTAAPGVLRTTWRDGRPYTLVEPATTNRMRNPRGEGAVIGGSMPTHWGADSTGGTTWDVVGVGEEDGIEYIDIRIHGAPTATFGQVRLETTQGVSTAVDDVWTGSAYVYMVDGSMDGIGYARIRLQERDNIGVFLTQSQTEFDPSDKTRLIDARRSHTLVASDPDVAHVVHMVGIAGMTVGVPIDITLRVAGAQLENSPLATSLTLPPEGTLAASTRDRDLVTTDYAHPPAPMAVYEAGIEAGTGAITNARAWQIGAGTNPAGRSLQVRRHLVTSQMWLSLGNSADPETESVAPLIPLGAEYQRLALLDIDGTDARVRLLQRYRETPGEGAWTDASGPWSDWLDVSALLAQGWESPHLTIGNVREGIRAGRLEISDLVVFPGSDWTLDKAASHV